MLNWTQLSEQATKHLKITQIRIQKKKGNYQIDIDMESGV